MNLIQISLSLSSEEINIECSVTTPIINELLEGVLSCVHCYPRNTAFHNSVIKFEKSPVSVE